VLALLREEGIAPAIDLRACVCVVDARQFADARWNEREDYREQIACAARLIVNEGNDAAVGALAALHKTAKMIDAREGLVLLPAIE
jgi:G3E family GTPase